MGFFPLVPVFIALAIEVSAQSAEECPELFQRFSKTHSYCKPANPSCNILKTFITEDDIDVILREHNNYRNRIATGNEHELPSAANMIQMEWDNELAEVAQKHSDQCKFEHDCSNCRRVQNFGVGQNIAIQYITNSPNVPDPNWPSAIKSWYDEVTVFNKKFMDPFIAPPPNPTYGHFSQLVWAESWRIGCGYTLYTEGDQHNQLYVCNYGPAGNIVKRSMYKEGKPCSGCPMNSCCGQTCGGTADYDGLCKITDNRAPTYKPEGSYIFYCDFQNQSDCDRHASGGNDWLISNTLSGRYLGIVLKGGEETTVTFNNTIHPKTSSFCLVINYRKGPNVAGAEAANAAEEIFTITANNADVRQSLPDFPKDVKQQFSEFSMSLSWNFETQYKITFSVPLGKPDQFLDIQSIYATEGSCNQQNF